MNKKIIVLGMACLVTWAVGGTARAEEGGLVPPRVREAFQQATPQHRQAAFEALREDYARLPQELRAHMAGKYPELPSATLRAALSVGGKHPGLPFSMAARLVKDLGGEPVQALLDVSQAAQEKYPGLPARLLQMRREAGLGRGLLARLEERHPGLRSDALGALRAQAPGLVTEVRATVLDVLRARHRGLGLQVLVEGSRYLDEQPDQVRADLARARKQGRGALLRVAQEHPGLLQGLVLRIQERQGEAMRAAAVDVMTEVAGRHGQEMNRATSQVLAEMERQHPGALADAWAMRREASQAFRRQVQAEFPELRPLVMRTLQEKHPDLLSRAADSLRQGWPELRSEFQAALEAELPGVGAEARAFLKTRYPDLEADALKALGG